MRALQDPQAVETWSVFSVQAIAAKEEAENLAFSAAARVKMLEQSLMLAEQRLHAALAGSMSGTLPQADAKSRPEADAWVHIQGWRAQKGQQQPKISAQPAAEPSTLHSPGLTEKAEKAGPPVADSPERETDDVWRELDQLRASNAQLKCELERLQGGIAREERPRLEMPQSPPETARDAAGAKGPTTPHTASSEAISRSQRRSDDSDAGSVEKEGLELGALEREAWSPVWSHPLADDDEDDPKENQAAVHASRSAVRTVELDGVPFSGSAVDSNVNAREEGGSQEIFMDSRSRAASVQSDAFFDAHSRAVSMEFDAFFDARSEADSAVLADAGSIQGGALAQLQVWPKGCG